MNENNELMMHVYMTADMGVSSTKSVLESIRTKENKIKHVLENELKEYEKFLNISKELLTDEDITPKGNSLFTKMSSDMGIMMETMKDNSDAAIAAMLIEGFTMGITTMQSKVKRYKSVCDKEVLCIARDFLDFQQNEVEKLKEFM